MAQFNNFGIKKSTQNHKNLNLNWLSNP